MVRVILGYCGLLLPIWLVKLLVVVTRWRFEQLGSAIDVAGRVTKDCETKVLLIRIAPWKVTLGNGHLSE